MRSISVSGNSFVEENKIMRKTASREIRRAYQSVNPYDGKTLKTFEELTGEQLETALETAAALAE